MQNKKVMYVVIENSEYEVVDQQVGEFNLQITKLDTISDLFSAISDSTQHVDIIGIDINRLIDGREGVDVHDVVNTISTMIKCRIPKCKDSNTQVPKICILVRETTDPKIIRQAMLISDVVIGQRVSGSWTWEVVKQNTEQILKGDYTTPKAILNLLKPKTQVKVKKNEIDLTPREQQILTLIQSRGASNKSIAKTLDISESTVKLHIGKVFKKYGVKNRTQLALFSKKNLTHKTEVQIKRRAIIS